MATRAAQVERHFLARSSGPPLAAAELSVSLTVSETLAFVTYLILIGLLMVQILQACFGLLDLEVPMHRSALLFIAIACFATSAAAQPALQLYIDGANYDPATETWITLDSTFDLWVIGNVETHGNINNVALSAAVYSSEVAGGTITLTEKTTLTLPDPSLPTAPSLNGLSVDGAIPQMNDGKFLGAHGIYGAGVRFYEWEIGNFTFQDSPIGDYMTTFPDPDPLDPATKWGQVNVYEVTVSGFSAVHFDAYNTIEALNHSTFAPFSHDAGGQVPEPGSILLMSLGLGTVVAGARRRRQRR